MFLGIGDGPEQGIEPFIDRLN